MTTVQTLTELGEQTGLKGTELKDFVREQQTLEREKREKNRENMREREGSRARKTENMASRYHITACGCKLAKPQTNMS